MKAIEDGLFAPWDTDLSATGDEWSEAERLAALPLNGFYEVILIVPADDGLRRVYVADSRGNVRMVTATRRQLERPSYFREALRQSPGPLPRHRTEGFMSRVASIEWRNEVNRAMERWATRSQRLPIDSGLFDGRGDTA